jgi:hypothetical protein
MRIGDILRCVYSRQLEGIAINLIIAAAVAAISMLAVKGRVSEVLG